MLGGVVEISFDQGLIALLNGAVSFVIAVAVAGVFWLIYQLMSLVRLNQALGWIFGRIDAFLRKVLIHVTGAALKTSWRRWGQFVLYFSGLAFIGAFAPLAIALVSNGVALISILAIYRYWERDEDKRIERVSEGRSNYDGQDLRDEMFAAIGLLLFFIPLGYVRISEASTVLAGNSAYPSLDAALFVWGELTKALPLVDWSEVFRVRNLSGVQAFGPIGLSLNFFIRILFDLLVLAAILRTLDILRSQSRGDDLRAEEEALRSEDPVKIEAALDRIIEVALSGRRHAISHLFEITRASRADGRLVEARWREKAARALVETADALIVSSVDLSDLDKRLLAIEAFKVSAAYMRASDPKFWAKTQNSLGVALSALGEQTGEVARLEEAVTAFRATLQVRTRDTMPSEWRATQNDLGNALRTLGILLDDTARLEEAVAAFRAVLGFFAREVTSIEWVLTQINLGAALRALGTQSGNTAPLEEAVTTYRTALQELTPNVMPLLWSQAQTDLGVALETLGAKLEDSALLEEALAAYRAALKVRTRNAMPTEWAIIQANIGNALQILSKQSRNIVHLEDSIVAYRAALEVRTREALPMAWASTQYNLGIALHVLGRQMECSEFLNEAVAAFRAALEVRTLEAVPTHWALTRKHLGIALISLGAQLGDAEILEEAASIYDELCEYFDAQGDHEVAKSHGEMSSGIRGEIENMKSRGVK